MIRFLKEDFFPVAFMLGFLLTSGYILGKYLYPVHPDAALWIGIFVILITIVMVIAYWQFMDKREKRKEQPVSEYEIEKVLILSTGHLTQQEFEGMQVDDEMPFRIIKHEYGAIVIMYDFNETLEFEDAKGFMLGHFPKLWRVLMFAKGMGCRYVNFDQDGEIYAKLPSYEW